MPQADEDEKIAQQWGPWTPEASLFHYATQDEQYTTVDPALGLPDPIAAESPQEDSADRRTHKLFTSYPDADRVLLSRMPVRLEEPFDRVLYGRRTHGDFTDEPVPLESFPCCWPRCSGPSTTSSPVAAH